MTGLMHFCLNWGNSGCDDNVSKFARWSEVGGNKEIALWPYGAELIQYDDICINCDRRQFEIYDNRCMLCESEELQFLGSGRIEHKPSTENVFLYRCNNYDSNLMSNIKF